MRIAAAIILIFSLCFPAGVSAEETDLYTGQITITGLNAKDIGGKVYVPSYIHNMQVRTIETSTFRGANNVEEIELMEGIEEIKSSAISHCDNLKKVVVPESCWELGESGWGSYLPAIKYCNNLETIEIYGDYVFLRIFVSDCPNIKDIIFHGDVEVTDDDFKYNFYKYKPGDPGIIPGVFTEKLDVTIHAKAGSNIEKFANENGFDFVALESEENVERETPNPDDARFDNAIPEIFSGYVDITEVNGENIGGKIYVPSYINNIPVKSFQGTGLGNTNVEELELLDGIESMDRISRCKSLKKVIIPASCKTLGGGTYLPAIEYCDSLETIELYGEYDVLPLFVADCPNLKNVVFYGDVKTITNKYKYNEFKYNFYKCAPRIKGVLPRTFTEKLDLTIYAKAGTDIEKFANENGFKFVALESEEKGELQASDWAKTELEKADALGLIPEILDGTDLTKKITRAEFAAVAVRVYEKLSGMSAEPTENNPFTDTNDVEVLKAYNIGAVNGTSEVTYEPSELLNREQAAAMLTRVFKKVTIDGWTPETDSQFTLSYEKPALFEDDEDISDWAKESVYFMAANGIINGVGNNKFVPKNITAEERAQGYASATREQALLIAVRMIENLSE